MMESLGDILRDLAIDQAEDGANDEWYTEALEAVRYIAEGNFSFTTDDVWEQLKQNVPQIITPESRAMGAVMREAAKRGWIISSETYRKSKRPECHSRPVLVWRSQL